MALIPRKSFVLNATVILIVALLAWLLFRNKSAQETALEDKGPGGLTIITELSPGNFLILDDGTFGGLQPELTEVLLPNTRITWTPVTSRKQAIEALMNGTADIYASSIPLSSFDAYPGTVSTQPIYSASFALIFKKGTDWMTDFSDQEARDTVFGSIDDPAAEQIIHNIAELSYPSVGYTALPESSQEVALKVYKGELKYAMVARQFAESLARKTKDSISYSTDLAFESNQVWLVREGKDSLLNILNNRIRTVKALPEYTEIIDRYFGE